jgi:hypothetical protein
MDPKDKRDDEDRVPDTDPAPPPSGVSEPSPSLIELFKRGKVVVEDDDGDYG